MHSVLLIDDDEMSRELITLLLEAADYSVRSSTSGDEAIAALYENSWRPDAVLCDLQMPGLAGAELATAVRACSPRSVILAMSASEPVGGLPAGYADFLRKPFGADDLTRTLRELAKAPEHAAEQSFVDLDETVLEPLAAVIPAQQLQQLYALGLSDTRKRIATMQRLAAAGDDAGLRREAHAIKGSASMLGAKAITTLARLLEETGITADASRQLDELIAAAARLEGILLLRFPGL